LNLAWVPDRLATARTLQLKANRHAQGQNQKRFSNPARSFDRRQHFASRRADRKPKVARIKTRGIYRTRSLKRFNVCLTFERYKSPIGKTFGAFIMLVFTEIELERQNVRAMRMEIKANEHAETLDAANHVSYLKTQSDKLMVFVKELNNG
jgi:Cft2 family RNA processing exonuclease